MYQNIPGAVLFVKLETIPMFSTSRLGVKQVRAEDYSCLT